ncbi:MAG TPA: helix-turn-helix domain-containing protein [Candidatus Limnocylindrales bacterium]|nr:helix-turn-helix domain-containing protein [Candidatus Limnocylindrales bacterium]
MAESNHRVSVEDVRKLALPLGTRVIAGDGLLVRTVSWTTVVFPEDGLANKNLQTDEMILVSGVENSATASAVVDVDVVRWARDQQAAALVLSDAPSPAAIAEANAYSLPVLMLPAGSRIRMVEKQVVSLLVDRKGQIERRGTQIYRQLTQISGRNEGMQELVGAMARLTNKAVIVQDKRLQVVVSQVQPQFVAYQEDIEAFLRKLDNLPVDLQDRHALSEVEYPVLMQSLPTPGLARLVAPIVTKDVGRGYLSIVGHDTELDDIDLLVAEHGAAACALEMAKAKAVSDTEKRLRGTFLDRILIGDVSQQEAVRQGERFDHDMTRTHVAIVCAWQGDKSPSLRRLETIINSVVASQHSTALVWQRERENEVLVFAAADDKEPIAAASRLARTIALEIQRQYPSTHAAIGVGQAARDVTQWRSSHRDATQAVDLARRLQTDTPLFIGDLGVYQLILGLGDRDKLIAFYERTLGPLLDYDQRQHADLIKTLEAFFNCHGNLSQTAEMLIVHRNTLLYRMNRINEIAQVDLNRPEIRLALHLALTIRRLLALN